MDSHPIIESKNSMSTDNIEHIYLPRASNSQSDNLALRYALGYAALGRRILPIKSPQKVPFDPETNSRMLNWPARATTSREQIVRWWGSNPDLGICIATGRASNLVVIDIDQKAGKNGENGLTALADLLGTLPATVEAMTPSGGRHLFFSYPDGIDTHLGNPTNFGRRALGFDTHVDIRADGGQVNVAPTQRAEGLYEWIASFEEVECAALPKLWVDAMLGVWPQSLVGQRKGSRSNHEIGEGSRNDTLFKEASRFRGFGLNEEAILALLLDMNQAKCTPPLEPQEVEAIARSVMRYPANDHFPRNDAENAQLFCRMHSDRVRYLHDTNQWLILDGHIWRPSKDRHEERLAVQTVEAMKDSAESIRDTEVRKAALNWVRRSGDQPRLRAMLQAAQRSTDIAASSTEFDQEPHVVPVANGFVDLRSGELVDQVNGMFTKSLPVQFDPTARSPMWDHFLSRILDPEVARFLQTFIGSCLHGLAPATQRFLLLQGDGANGKSVLVDTLWQVLEPFCQRLSPDSLATKKVPKDARSDLTKLAGARLVVASEFPSRRQMDASLLKQMTGDAELVARDLYKSETSIPIGWGLFVVSNPLPLAPEWDYAFWRRAVRLHFDRTIPKNEQDPSLKERLVSREAPGILNWIIEGAVRFHKESLSVPTRCEADTAKWRESTGTIGRFVASRCTIGGAERVKFADFYASYARAAFSTYSGAQAYDQTQVCQWLSSFGFSTQSDHEGDWVIGLGLSRRI